MREKIKCLNCGYEMGEVILASQGYLVYVGLRADKRFCSPACRSAHHREHGSTQTHANLPHDIGVQCTVCDNWFEVSPHAYRGGQRQAQYCSPRCRQKAYRQRKK